MSLIDLNNVLQNIDPQFFETILDLPDNIETSGGRGLPEEQESLGLLVDLLDDSSDLSALLAIESISDLERLGIEPSDFGLNSLS